MWTRCVCPHQCCTKSLPGYSLSSQQLSPWQENKSLSKTPYHKRCHIYACPSCICFLKNGLQEIIEIKIQTGSSEKWPGEVLIWTYGLKSQKNRKLQSQKMNANYSEFWTLKLLSSSVFKNLISKNIFNNQLQLAKISFLRTITVNYSLGFSSVWPSVPSPENVWHQIHLVSTSVSRCFPPFNIFLVFGNAMFTVTMLGTGTSFYCGVIRKHFQDFEKVLYGWGLLWCSDCVSRLCLRLLKQRPRDFQVLPERDCLWCPWFYHRNTESLKLQSYDVTDQLTKKAECAERLNLYCYTLNSTHL